MSLPRPQFQTVNGGKRVVAQRVPAPTAASPPPTPTSQHDDLIKFIFESWSKVTREFSEQNCTDSGRSPTVTYYQEREPNPHLKDFEPFDLEAWWGRRLVQNLQAASSSSSSSTSSS